MITEIELKYLLPTSSTTEDGLSSKISEMLTAKNIRFTLSQKQLSNDYYDSEALDLRKMDMGLRIRAEDTRFEQTIKTAGKVVDGLHQRPEYNIDIEQNSLSLALFPQEIWPDNTDLEALQNKLSILFSTDFIRQAWVIEFESSLIELALDRGNITTSLSTQSLVINELEIELVKGEQQALFNLAKLLKVLVALEPGNLSKAARGYALCHQS